MEELIIKYKDAETFEILKSLSKYLHFSILKPKTGKTKKLEYINGVPYIPGEKLIDLTELSDLLTGRKLDAGKLRRDTWTRRK